MTTQTQNKNFSFDGFGINGADQYSSRLATLTPEGQKQNVGKLFAAAPELLEALQLILKHEGEIKINGIGIESDSDNLEKAKLLAMNAIAQAKGEA